MPSNSQKWLVLWFSLNRHNSLKITSGFRLASFKIHANLSITFTARSFQYQLWSTEEDNQKENQMSFRLSLMVSGPLLILSWWCWCREIKGRFERDSARFSSSAISLAQVDTHIQYCIYYWLKMGECIRRNVGCTRRNGTNWLAIQYGLGEDEHFPSE